MKRKFTAKLSVTVLAMFTTWMVVAQTPYVHYTFDADGSDAMGNVGLNVGPNVSFVNDPDRGMVAETTISDATTDATLDVDGQWFTPSMTAYTISTWFKYEDMSNWYGAIFAYGEGTTNNAKYTYFSPSYAGWTRLGIQATLTGFGATANTVLAKDGGVSVGSRNQNAADDDFTLPDWHHVAVVFDVTEIKIYLDGQLWTSGIAEISIADQVAGGIDTYKIGRNVHATQQRMSARYDDFKVYHVALSPIEMAMEAGTEITYTTSFSDTPDATSAVIIAGDYAESADLQVASMLVSSGSTFTVKSGQTLTVDQYLEVEGSLVVESGGSLITNGDVVGDVTIQRNSTFNSSTGKYSIVGSPVADATTTNLGVNALIYAFDEGNTDVSDNSVNRYTMLSAGSPMVPGVGYFSAFTGDSEGAVSFTGTPNTGNIDVPVTRSVDGFNLISNPYTAAIDIASFTGDTDNDELTGSVYIWDDNNTPGTRGSSADYITVNSSGIVDFDSEAGGNSFDGKIRSVQGFFVEATTAGTISFKEAHRVSTSNDDAGFFRKAGVDFSRFKLAIKSNEFYSETLLAFRDEATQGIDRLYDAKKFPGQGSLQIYSLIDQQPFTIQSLPSLGGDIILPLGLEVEFSGTYEMDVFAMENIPDHYQVILVDHDAGMEYDLSESISIDLQSGLYKNRFAVKLSDASTLAINQNLAGKLQVYMEEGLTKIWLTDVSKDAPSKVTIYDLTGQKISDGHVNLSNGYWEGTLNVSKGVFYMVLTTSEGKAFKTKFLSK